MKGSVLRFNKTRFIIKALDTCKAIFSSETLFSDSVISTITIVFVGFSPQMEIKSVLIPLLLI